MDEKSGEPLRTSLGQSSGPGQNPLRGSTQDPLHERLDRIVPQGFASAELGPVDDDTPVTTTNIMFSFQSLAAKIAGREIPRGTYDNPPMDIANISKLELAITNVAAEMGYLNLTALNENEYIDLVSEFNEKVHKTIYLSSMLESAVYMPTNSMTGDQFRRTFTQYTSSERTTLQVVQDMLFAEARYLNRVEFTRKYEAGQDNRARGMEDLAEHLKVRATSSSLRRFRFVDI